MLFDVLYGWRKWRGQRGMWLVLIVSLCLFCTLIGFSSNLIWMLSSDRPQWVLQKDPLITIVNQDHNGNVQPISVYDIEILQGLPAIKNVASISIQSAAVTVGLKDISGLNIGFYSRSLIELLAIPKPFTQKIWEEKQVVLSSRFYNQYKTSKGIDDLTLYYKGERLPIAGVALPSMAKFGDRDIDIWVPDSYLLQDVPTMFAENPELYVKTKGSHYGFAQLSRAHSAEQLQEPYRLLRAQTPRPQGGFVDSHFNPLIIDGIEIKPNERLLIQKQSWVLLVLLLCFGFIICSGIVSAYMQQSIVRRAEIQLKVALGGERRDIFLHLVRENLLTLAVLALVSPVLSIIFTDYVANIPLYKIYFDGGLSFNIWLWVVAVFVSACIFLLCAQMPMIDAMSSHFSRGRQGQMEKKQVLMSRFILLIQLTVIISVIILSLVLSFTEWKKYQKINISQSVYSFKPVVKDQLSMSLSAKQFNGDWQVLGSEVALSSTMFTDLGSQRLSYQVIGQSTLAKPINSLYVSSNFFDLLGINSILLSTLTTNSLVINQTMAYQLAEELGLADYRSVKGIDIEVSGFYYTKQFKVAGIIEDQLHFGINQSPKPVLYLHLSEQNPLYAHRIAPVVYTKHANHQLFHSHLNDWADLQSSALSYQDSGSLAQQIVSTDPAGRLLFITSSAMALMIFLLVIFTLYYRFQFTVKVQQVKWAILLAVGAQKISLIMQMIKLNLILTGLASTFSICLLLTLDSQSLRLLGVSLVQPLLMCTSIIICMLIVVSITFLASRKTLKNSISDLLRI
ncbi:FtsX-like permease family protein [Shewanella subflava]|uniref:ABC3 transporter permease C-terminal domain-containing protein n=1 Tax=Shewanella subflava TaxID=2986476 RepID=A0ABT3IC71_9GAMM|nr:FtsX-like permease family protein [Shewanella subflava]MCW3173637.1 hypothetical protein [Shewanella subflava]